jgi:hypothetical protein
MFIPDKSTADQCDGSVGIVFFIFIDKPREYIFIQLDVHKK